MSPPATSFRSPGFPVSALAFGAAAAAGIVWAYFTTLADAADRWASDPQYSHGFLVPAFALYLLYSRSGMLAGRPAGGHWLGVAVLAAALAVRAAGVVFFVGWLDVASVAGCVAGAAAVAYGRPGLKWAWPAAGFLLFMAPLPFRVQLWLGESLQTVVTNASTYALVTLGVPAVAEGNVILLGRDVRIGVVQACSGLGMMVTFAALAAALAYVRRADPWWERLAVVLAAAPVAVGANVLRVTATGVLFHGSQDAAARALFHDFAGWVMIPVGLAGLEAAAWVCRRTVVPAAPPGTVFVPPPAGLAARPAGVR